MTCVKSSIEIIPFWDYEKEICNQFWQLVFLQGFHDYAVEWQQHSMTFLVDGQPILRAVCSCKKGHRRGWFTANGAKSRVVSACGPFDRPFHIILNLAVGGEWPGEPNCFTVFPQTMTVQSIHVWSL